MSDRIRQVEDRASEYLSQDLYPRYVAGFQDGLGFALHNHLLLDDEQWEDEREKVARVLDFLPWEQSSRQAYIDSAERAMRALGFRRIEPIESAS